MIDDMYKIFDRIDTLKKRFGLLNKNVQQQSAKTETQQFSPETDSGQGSETVLQTPPERKSEALDRSAQIKEAAIASVLQTITSNENALSSLQNGASLKTGDILESASKSYRDSGADETPLSQIIDTLK